MLERVPQAFRPERPANEPPVLLHDDYLYVFSRIFKAMTRDWDEEEAAATVEAEWQHDRRGLDNISVRTTTPPLGASHRAPPSFTL